MTEQNTWRARPNHPGHDPKLRAGDRDREAVAQTVRTQHGEGRLDTDELEDRIDRCYEAKTIGELEDLVADLPREPRLDEPHGDHCGRWRLRLIAVVPIVVGLAAISALTGRHLFWLAVPLIFLTVRLAPARHRPAWTSRPHHLGDH